MRCSLFLRIVKGVKGNDSYFVQKKNTAGVVGFSCLQKVTAAYRQLVYGVPADYVDDVVRNGESNAIESLRRFVKSVCEVFGPEKNA